MGDKKTRRRPLALPITLILLVMSIMGNVLYSTKNIEYSQREKVEAGQQIFDGFANGKKDMDYWGQYIAQIQQMSTIDAQGARLTASHLSEALVQNESGLAVLMKDAAELSSEEFSQASGEYDALIKRMHEELRSIGDGNGALKEEELQNVEAAKAVITELSTGVNKFHFSMEGNRNALIRLSGGYDWLDIAAILHNTIKSYTNGK
ncbi:hypothetical protein [Paenibacillus sp. L3-i20]|uniref:hypothetical protein n=1 Tax=Paenibacillus sp. L3-i20 TaxID=2905833 RepID=UPI001EDD37B8|nr:hypothetical protein [Paenibacillus sp. L3-i20]GKU79724.1 hypothetical protein L3i20_v241210 [Paenibacillus sp. L3-i20]